MKKGFTIIEVALVLAIAGLIFLMVFVALPGLRAQQRDTERREHIMSFIDKLKDYERNNRGALPSGANENTIIKVTKSNSSSGSENSWAGFYREYLDESKTMDPVGEYYEFNIGQCKQSHVDQDCTTSGLSDVYDAPFPNGYKMFVVLQATCKGDKAVATGNPRSAAIVYKLEGAGVHCNNT